MSLEQGRNPHGAHSPALLQKHLHTQRLTQQLSDVVQGLTPQEELPITSGVARETLLASMLALFCLHKVSRYVVVFGNHSMACHERQDRAHTVFRQTTGISQLCTLPTSLKGAVTEEAFEAIFAPELANNLVQCLTVQSIVVHSKGRIADGWKQGCIRLYPPQHCSHPYTFPSSSHTEPTIVQSKRETGRRRVMEREMDERRDGGRDCIVFLSSDATTYRVFELSDEADQSQPLNQPFSKVLALANSPKLDEATSCQTTSQYDTNDVTADLFGAENFGTIAAFGDFNSDKQTDIFIIREQSELQIFLADSKPPYFKSKVQIPKDVFPRFQLWHNALSPSPGKMRVPHSNAFIDLNKDFTADLFLTTVGPAFETWISKWGFEERGIWEKDKVNTYSVRDRNGNFTRDEVLPADPPAGSKSIGQSSFVDFARKCCQPSPFQPCLQFPPSATLSANLHHTMRLQREGEMKSRKEGGRERMRVNKAEEKWTK
ncbi:hypothetical protein INR49_032952 [Caranx melampygus]|nr:hypothetical protein INR49_032952 [Caranx melampygus]